MKWEGQRQSDNVEDRRAGGGGLGGGGFRIGGRGIGLGTVALAVVGGLIFGVNPLTLLGMLSGGGGGEAPSSQQAPAQRPPANDALASFVSTVLADTEDVWRAQFKQANMTYSEPKLRLFRGSEPTACGTGQAAMGPFYCPGDQKVYIDLGFFDVMKQRLGAPGDFAQAYVIAHEVGHHVQNLMGITGKVDAMRGRGSEAQQNALSVRLELQADCFAGVWAYNAANGSDPLIEAITDQDIAEGLDAAAKVGDDYIQKKFQGRVSPEAWTHGSSAQRQKWFTTGYRTGEMTDCDTFSGSI